MLSGRHLGNLKFAFFALPGVAQFVGVLFYKPKCFRFDPRSGHILRLQV